MGKKKSNDKIVLKGENKRKFFIILVMFAVTSLIIFAFSIAWLLLNKQIEEKKVRKEGNVEIALGNKEDSGLIIEDAFPMNEEGGSSRESKNFSVINNGEEHVNYSVVLKLDEEKISDCKNANDGVCEITGLDTLRYKIVKDGVTFASKLLKDSQNVVDLGIIQPGDDNKINIELQIWVDFEATNVPNNAKFFGKLEIVTQTQ